MVKRTRRKWGGLPTGVEALVWVVAFVAVVIACFVFLGPPVMSAFGDQPSPQSPQTGAYARKAVDSVWITQTLATGNDSDPPLLDKAVTDAQLAQALYHAAFALPDYPGGIMNCPLDYNNVYHLAFMYHGSMVLTVRADTSGCQAVSLGDLGARMALGHDEFWQALANALGTSENNLWLAPTTPTP